MATPIAQRTSSAGGAFPLQNRAQAAVSRARTMIGGAKPQTVVNNPNPPGQYGGPKPRMMAMGGQVAGSAVGPTPDMYSTPSGPPGMTKPMPGAPGGPAVERLRPWMGGTSPGGLPADVDAKPPAMGNVHPLMERLRGLLPGNAGGGPLPAGGPGAPQPPVGEPPMVEEPGMPPEGPPQAMNGMQSQMLQRLPPRLQEAVQAGRIGPQAAFDRAMQNRAGFAAAQGYGGAPAASLMEVLERYRGNSPTAGALGGAMGGQPIGQALPWGPGSTGSQSLQAVLQSGALSPALASALIR